MGKGNGSISGCADVTCHGAAFSWLHSKVLLVFLPLWLAHGLRDLPSPPAGQGVGGRCVLARPLVLSFLCTFPS